jgi:hypothetical protein
LRLLLRVERCRRLSPEQYYRLRILPTSFKDWTKSSTTVCQYLSKFAYSLFCILFVVSFLYHISPPVKKLYRSEFSAFCYTYIMEFRHSLYYAEESPSLSKISRVIASVSFIHLLKESSVLFK